MFRKQEVAGILFSVGKVCLVLLCPGHLDPLVDLSVGIHWMCTMNDEHKDRFQINRYSYIYDDMAYAFLMMNNRLRFDKFCSRFMQANVERGP